MKSMMTWIDSEARIVLVESVGLWMPSDLLDTVEATLSNTPQYLIWNPSNIMFPEAYLRPYKDSDPNRQTALNIIVKALLKRTLRLLIIIQTKDLPIFEAIHIVYSQSGAGHLIKFTDSVENASKVIANHQVLGDNML